MHTAWADDRIAFEAPCPPGVTPGPHADVAAGPDNPCWDNRAMPAENGRNDRRADMLDLHLHKSLVLVQYSACAHVRM